MLGLLFSALLPDDEGRQLLRRVAAGDDRALEKLYRLHAARVFAAASRLLGNVSEAEEIVQETFLEIWNRADSFDGSRGQARPWITSIGRNRAIDRLRARGSRIRTLDQVKRDDTVPPATPEHNVETAQSRKRVVDALDILPPEQRAVVELAYFDGLSQSEIASKTGDPLGTVKGRARAALEKLAEHLSKSGAA